jgi:hypothetical protein
MGERQRLSLLLVGVQYHLERNSKGEPELEEDLAFEDIQ